MAIVRSPVCDLIPTAWCCRLHTAPGQPAWHALACGSPASPPLRAAMPPIILGGGYFKAAKDGFENNFAAVRELLDDALAVGVEWNATRVDIRLEEHGGRQVLVIEADGGRKVLVIEDDGGRKVLVIEDDGVGLGAAAMEREYFTLGNGEAKSRASLYSRYGHGLTYALLRLSARADVFASTRRGAATGAGGGEFEWTLGAMGREMVCPRDGSLQSTVLRGFGSATKTAGELLAAQDGGAGGGAAREARRGLALLGVPTAAAQPRVTRRAAAAAAPPSAEAAARAAEAAAFEAELGAAVAAAGDALFGSVEQLRAGFACFERPGHRTGVKIVIQLADEVMLRAVPRAPGPNQQSEAAAGEDIRDVGAPAEDCLARRIPSWFLPYQRQGLTRLLPDRFRPPQALVRVQGAAVRFEEDEAWLRALAEGARLAPPSDPRGKASGGFPFGVAGCRVYRPTLGPGQPEVLMQFICHPVKSAVLEEGWKLAYSPSKAIWDKPKFPQLLDNARSYYVGLCEASGSSSPRAYPALMALCGVGEGQELPWLPAKQGGQSGLKTDKALKYINRALGGSGVLALVLLNRHGSRGGPAEGASPGDVDLPLSALKDALLDGAQNWDTKALYQAIWRTMVRWAWFELRPGSQITDRGEAFAASAAALPTGAPLDDRGAPLTADGAAAGAGGGGAAAAGAAGAGAGPSSPAPPQTPDSASTARASGGAAPRAAAPAGGGAAPALPSAAWRGLAAPLDARNPHLAGPPLRPAALVGERVWVWRKCGAAAGGGGGMFHRAGVTAWDGGSGEHTLSYEAAPAPRRKAKLGRRFWAPAARAGAHDRPPDAPREAPPAPPAPAPAPAAAPRRPAVKRERDEDGGAGEDEAGMEGARARPHPRLTRQRLAGSDGESDDGDGGDEDGGGGGSGSGAGAGASGTAQPAPAADPLARVRADGEGLKGLAARLRDDLAAPGLSLEAASELRAQALKLAGALGGDSGWSARARRAAADADALKASAERLAAAAAAAVAAAAAPGAAAAAAAGGGPGGGGGAVGATPAAAAAAAAAAPRMAGGTPAGAGVAGGAARRAVPPPPAAARGPAVDSVPGAPLSRPAGAAAAPRRVAAAPAATVASAAAPGGGVDRRGPVQAVESSSGSSEEEEEEEEGEEEEQEEGEEGEEEGSEEEESEEGEAGSQAESEEEAGSQGGSEEAGSEAGSEEEDSSGGEEASEGASSAVEDD
ncbi:hypothetical protein Rsub_10949 [Raphidocelis subcapitata]|uniref:Histidine kinase/HSP90-like ATPase domain-containing protein n=1 Tax=Raphidocelis subcapitata TaxID=307507 RepID=A0A2V0PEM9_9CHLO|nr:hypothetical protein Rsub_10949 [Raphidocelis subcapitata]|eukprot:GBF98286.1 hypothetical protein Rsub_10949 [Raphidocelis subcapitata]